MKFITSQSVVVSVVFSVIMVAGVEIPLATPGFAQEAAPQTVAKRLGTIKAISGSAIILTPDTGSELTVTVQPTARLIKIAPGEKDLKNATPIALQDFQVGDKIRVRGYASDDGKSFTALEVLQITTSAIAGVRDRMSEDWQKRGINGPVSAIDPTAGTVSITTGGFAGKKTIVVHIATKTIVRRYAPDSARFEDAKVSTLQEVHVGDQLRARGTRSADGNDFAADEIVTGYFPSIEGTIKSIDASASTMSIQDVLSKKTVQVKITSDSQLHKIPAEMANGFAARLKSQMPPGTPGAGRNASPAAATGNAATGNGSTANAEGAKAGAMQGPGGNGAGGMGPGGARPGGMGGGGRAGGGFDFQRLLEQTPVISLADLHKGDAVVILATQGTPSGDGSTVVKLFSGVEPILQAAPSASQAMMLAPWSLGGAPGGGDSQ